MFEWRISERNPLIQTDFLTALGALCQPKNARVVCHHVSERDDRMQLLDNETLITIRWLRI
jgi:hypothetical protein